MSFSVNGTGFLPALQIGRAIRFALEEALHLHGRATYHNYQPNNTQQGDQQGGKGHEYFSGR